MFMSKVNLADYAATFDQYAEEASSVAGVVDVLWCGTVSNPGVSDIDVILVVEDWSTFKPTLSLLNPEIGSALFTHGPFLCSQDFIPSLNRFTTLRPFKDNVEKINHENYSRINHEPIIVTLRQARILIKFLNLRFPLKVARTPLLVIKSILHSFDDLMLMGLLQDNVGKIENIRTVQNSIRNTIESGLGVDNKKYRDLISAIKDLLSVAIGQLANWIRSNVFLAGCNEIRKLNDVEIFREFLRFSEFGEDRSSFLIDGSMKEPIEKWRDLFSDLKHGYTTTGALWRGAEFPFMIVDVHEMMGPKIWMRRAIKHGVKLRKGFINS